MCRNIKTLFNFDPPVTEEEVRAAAAVCEKDQRVHQTVEGQ